MSFGPTIPYNYLPPLPPQANVETTAVLKKAITAGRALAELKGVGETIPNQSILVNALILELRNREYSHHDRCPVRGLLGIGQRG